MMQKENKEDFMSNYSEEVQAIIDRMPTQWVKWFALCVGSLIGIVILLSFWIKYPDTVEGEVSVTATKAPVRLVANNSGRMQLLVKNRQSVKKNEVIAFIESGADYHHVLQVEALLFNLYADHEANYPLPDSLLLGDVSTAYNSFYISYKQYRQLLTSDLYATMRISLQQQIEIDKEIEDNLHKEIALKKQVLEAMGKRLEKDSILYAAKGISQQEYLEKESNYLSLQETLLALESNCLIKQSEIRQSQIEIQRTLLEEQENKEKAFAELVAQQNVLSNAISVWKEKYMEIAPITGEVEYLDFWKDNSFVQAGQELFTVIPTRNDIVGEVMIASYGAGKVKEGQTANVKINNYPYEEYGMLKGKVHSISRLTNKMETNNNIIDVYLVEIVFPDGLVSNFGKTLPLDFESKGTVEIITKRKRLIERLFDNLRSIGEK